MGIEYKQVLSKSELLHPQYEPNGFYYTYYTFSSKFNGKGHNISWEEFRKKYMEFGGDGISAASKLIHQEPSFKKNKIGYGDTPIATMLQKHLMNFTTNQSTDTERNIQIEALTKTLQYFGDTI